MRDALDVTTSQDSFRVAYCAQAGCSVDETSNTIGET